MAKAVQKQEKPPAHRMYAKLVLLKDGSKQYLPIDEYDLNLYEEARKELSIRQNAYPVVPIEPGYNTNQLLNYCYLYWHKMFNERQLLCLNILAERIKEINDIEIRDLFICLFSGTLEFNNMFASFKGEGTGAVRHLFSHHILKPERTPLEANLWGTPKSSGSFSTLFESRILKAIDYCEKPFEIKVCQNKGKAVTEKVYGLSPAIGFKIADNFDKISNKEFVYLDCGDSAKRDIPTESIDAIITDPPFFDNVHYSQLADFFYVWQRYLRSDKIISNETTRHPNEVQSSEPAVFAERLQRVFSECYRVLKLDGLMVFTYHHSKAEGWQAILRAIVNSGLVIIATHPIKSEMSVATPKSQATSPIDLDIIIVCEKRDRVELKASLADTLKLAVRHTDNQVKRFNTYERHLSRNDVMVVFMAQVIKQLSWYPELEIGLDWLEAKGDLIQQYIEEIYVGQKFSHSNNELKRMD